MMKTMVDEIVSFDEAKKLAEDYGYSENVKYCYIIGDKNVLEECERQMNANAKTWTGRSFTHQTYSAPTRKDALAFMMRIADSLKDDVEYVNNKVTNIEMK